MSTAELATSDDIEQKSRRHFEQIPVWRAINRKKAPKCFEVTLDEFSGRIPVTRLESWRDFTELLESDFFNRPGVQLVFRGHRRFSWNLMPTLGRLTENGIVTEAMAHAQLDRFKHAVRGRLNDAAMVDEDEELWSVGQHHGLMTPLLDWTYSPYVALFFAFHREDNKNEERDNPYRAVYVLNKTFLTESSAKTGIRVCEPRKDDHGRLVNQAGLFTISPFDATLENKLIDFLSSEDSPDQGLSDAVQAREKDNKTIEPIGDEAEAEILARYICKIYIRNEGRDACLRHLRRMNVHHASLFPDLLGASEYCNILANEAEMAAAPKHQERVHSVLVDAETPTEQPTVSTTTITRDEQESIEELLRRLEGAEQVEPGRIALMAGELAFSIAKNKVVDWETREAVQARLRNIVRVVLRKYGYPQALREQVAEQVLALAKLTDESVSS
jgi:FRG domain/Domain of unknown function (DUF3387)